MKITKFNQSCLLVEAQGKRILIDPGSVGYDESMLESYWTQIDIILITHKHKDHCLEDAINEIVKRDRATVYTTLEVIESSNLTEPSRVKEGDILNIFDIKIEVTKGLHGFVSAMKASGAEVKENVGYIIDDGTKRLYITSDTINFNNDYKCDVLAMPFNGNGLTLGIIDGIDFIKNINPGVVLPIHMQHPNPLMNPDINILKEALEKENIDYKVLGLFESIEV